MKVYAEHGALREDLYALDHAGRIQLTIFPYENKVAKVRRRAVPSAAQYRDLAHITIGEMDWPISEMSASKHYANILRIVGERNSRDALHIDSANKSGCRAFFSRDRKDIISHGQALEALLGMRFFHPDDDWAAFLSFLETA